VWSTVEPVVEEGLEQLKRAKELVGENDDKILYSISFALFLENKYKKCMSFYFSSA
jgi:hypothetical protein